MDLKLTWVQQMVNGGDDLPEQAILTGSSLSEAAAMIENLAANPVVVGGTAYRAYNFNLIHL